MVDVTVKFEWSGGSKCQIHYLVINDERVVMGGPPMSDPSTGTFQVPTAPVYLVAFALEFVGQKRTGLKASAAVNGGKLQKLDTSDESWHVWKGYGVIT